MTTSAAPQSPTIPELNRLIVRLPPDERTAFEGCLETIPLKVKDLLFEPDQPHDYVYFPHNGVISLVTVLRDGDLIEAMTVGKEGFAGLAIFHGANSSACRGICQVSGYVSRITVQDFRRCMDLAPEMKRLLHRYAQYVFETVSQSAACNRLHVIEQRCARWLLMTHDRVGRDDFDLTQEFLAEMLAVRRPGVTVAIGILVSRGLIGHGRGTIRIIDRAGLEQASCECYNTVKKREAILLQ
ncbi:MAG: Crp/Fnr family transcriptional regulator [Gemmatimonadaceae bacterium]|nr:Crp/Fnr family transcriptional regulator [Gemmatimonadaceae bacterium]